MKKTATFLNQGLDEILQDRLNTLETLFEQKAKAIEGAPRGNLHVVKRGKITQFYHRTDPTDKSGAYIKKSNLSLLRKLSQKKYDQKIIKLLAKEIRHIRIFLRNYKPCELSGPFSELNEEEKRYVTPVCMEDADYVKAWQVSGYEQPAFREGTAEFYTKRGERVRSKSEILIADALHEMGVPYMYECPLKLGGGIVVHPDFMVLNLRTRKTLYWEHLGMLDDRDYLQNALRKVAEYEKSGIYPGTELIITAETGYMPLGNAELKNVIRHYCF